MIESNHRITFVLGLGSCEGTLKEGSDTLNLSLVTKFIRIRSI